jgi:phosphatidylserine decarboxylase precursor-related protein
MTSRLTIEIQGVQYDNIEPMMAFLKEHGLEIGGTGPKVRPVVSCKGTTCQYGLIDTFSLSEKIHEKFYIGYHNVGLPNKFKIAVGGCHNNCVKPELNDLSVIGQRYPTVDPEKCKGCKKCQVETACPIKVAKVADGKVVIIDKVVENEFIKGECLQVSVYMDFFNVHVNFWPLDGEVTYFKYHPGKYLLAYLPKASELNEHTSIGMKTEYGNVFFKQIAGTFARRIVFNAKPGDTVKKADECGIIKFGSRIDMYLPLNAEINVKLGDYVKACETVIARLHK